MRLENGKQEIHTLILRPKSKALLPILKPYSSGTMFFPDIAGFCWNHRVRFDNLFVSATHGFVFVGLTELENPLPTVNYWHMDADFDGLLNKKIEMFFPYLVLNSFWAWLPEWRGSH